MAINEALTTFVRQGLERGVARRDLAAAMTAAGWTAADVDAALESFADTPFALPVPRPQASPHARDAFLHLVLFTSLFVVAFNLGDLLFALIDRAIPDPAGPDSALGLGAAIRWSVSALVVATPVFLYVLYVSRLVGREARHTPSRRESKVRRWLTYLTLFVAAAVLIGDTTVLVYRLLGGELTARFVLKALVVGAIAGTGFRYYLGDLRADEGAGQP